MMAVHPAPYAFCACCLRTRAWLQACPMKPPHPPKGIRKDAPHTSALRTLPGSSPQSLCHTVVYLYNNNNMILITLLINSLLPTIHLRVPLELASEIFLKAKQNTIKTFSQLSISMRRERQITASNVIRLISVGQSNKALVEIPAIQ